MGAHPISAGAIAVALIACAVILASGVHPGLVLGLLLVWLATLWLATPPPPIAQPRKQSESVQITRSGMRDLIEHSGLPLMILDGNRIIAANAAARETLGAHVVGQDARLAFRHPAAVDLLSRPKGGTAKVQGLTGPRSNWLMSRQLIDRRYCMIELINRTSESDISRAHTDFVANASHELRTPLASIIGYMETLEDEGDRVDPRQVRRFYAIVLREARRLQALVDDLMSLSRVEAEKHDQPRDRIDLALVAGQAARDGAGHDRQSRLRMVLPDAGLEVRGDREQLEQLVRNLVDNALKYGAHDQPVTLRLERGERDMAVLKVEDCGDGIAPEHIPHLTRRFYRTEPGRSRAGGGTGLGLAIVKHIVERHRGRLDIASTLGQGTTVTVKLPLAADKATLQKPIEAEAGNNPGGAGDLSMS